MIELGSLTKRYGRSVGVDGLDLDVGGGEVFGLLGPNGAGKTTTLRCLAGLLRPSAGAVRVLGLDPVADHRRVAPSIGYLPGGCHLSSVLTGRHHQAGPAAGARAWGGGGGGPRAGAPPAPPGSRHGRVGAGPGARTAARGAPA
ncbi:ATP-binding cassette domain-containing protein, partial [Kitasatospora purpeofusca]|uniref:ATP-binding cassette domain-containing protein n=1 Tax=Kitasatospora purpeofusca TaxID=67352 RepID=UPI0036CFF80C